MVLFLVLFRDFFSNIKLTLIKDYLQLLWYTIRIGTPTCIAFFIRHQVLVTLLHNDIHLLELQLHLKFGILML